MVIKTWYFLSKCASAIFVEAVIIFPYHFADNQILKLLDAIEKFLSSERRSHWKPPNLSFTSSLAKTTKKNSLADWLTPVQKTDYFHCNLNSMPNISKLA